MQTSEWPEVSLTFQQRAEVGQLVANNGQLGPEARGRRRYEADQMARGRRFARTWLSGDDDALVLTAVPQPAVRTASDCEAEGKETQIKYNRTASETERVTSKLDTISGLYQIWYRNLRFLCRGSQERRTNTTHCFLMKNEPPLHRSK